MTRPELVAAAHALDDGRSHRAIAKALEARGYVSALGKRLTHGQVARLLAYDAPDAAAMVISNVAQDAAEFDAA